jgi:hypothetical protein
MKKIYSRIDYTEYTLSDFLVLFTLLLFRA